MMGEVAGGADPKVAVEKGRGCGCRSRAVEGAGKAAEVAVVGRRMQKKKMGMGL